MTSKVYNETKKQYAVKFSTGEVVTRKSHRKYISASAYVNSETGEVRNVTFSSKEKSAPSRAGIFYWPAPQRRYFKTRKAFLKCLEEQKELEKIWKVETVKL